jgi:AraC-like DNA-binding protein
MSGPAGTTPRSPRPGTRGPAFTEAPAWQPVGAGWRPLFAAYREQGFSFEWHDFTTAQPTDWGRSFHPGSVEICLNLAGRGVVTDGKQELVFGPLTAGFYRQEKAALAGTRTAGERHQFLTVELAPEFLRQNLDGADEHLHAIARSAVNGGGVRALSEVTRLTAEHQQTIRALRHPPVFAGAQKLWYRAKAIEVMAAFLFCAPPDREMFCHRQQRVAQERAEKVVVILRESLCEPPSLEELGRRVGCSPFYLSRIFSQQMGRTISQHLRQLRMERAAELLHAGKHNVTEVAMEVGYSSSSHFSVAFHETFGCCPGLYPLATPAQRSGDAR